MNRAQWVMAFVAYMTAQGVTADEGELERLAEDLYARQGHLDPAVVGHAPGGNTRAAEARHDTDDAPT